MFSFITGNKSKDKNQDVSRLFSTFIHFNDFIPYLGFGVGERWPQKHLQAKAASPRRLLQIP
jgi:hypothetical protein